ncbi:MAG: FISUMP domain-containing protein [Patescibacteria group bacterium]|nr:MAG: FISUMP domain-containing protein [Patescibacteria group bacterium]
MLYKENKKNQENKKTPQIVEVFNSGVSSKLNSRLYNNKAFTLIELLVVIAIIGILSTLVIVALGNSRAGARDAKRLNDLKAMANALELYYADNNAYPEADNFSPGATFEAGGVVYMGKVPNNPTPHTDGNCPDNDYTYTQVESGQSYNISTCLGTQAQNSPSTSSTTVSYSPSGIFQCGQNIQDSRDNNTYQTVQIGNQCWMKENLAYLPSVVGPATESETDPYYYVYGYSGTDVVAAKATTNYTTHGVLYNWPAATTACPTGWKLPTDQEFNTLEQYTVATIASTDTQYACNTSATGWQRCADNSGNDAGGAKGVGKSLKKVGQGSGVGAGDDLVGFSSFVSGFRNVGGTFSSLSSLTYLWMSSSQSGSLAWSGGMNSSYSTVRRSALSKSYGWSVRCLKDS